MVNAVIISWVMFCVFALVMAWVLKVRCDQIAKLEKQTAVYRAKLSMVKAVLLNPRIDGHPGIGSFAKRCHRIERDITSQVSDIPAPLGVVEGMWDAGGEHFVQDATVGPEDAIAVILLKYADNAEG